MLTRLEARTFRNLQDLDWSFGAGSHLLLGPNGAGKTSVLEAIYQLATTRSFRTRQLGDCARHGSDGFLVEGEVETDRRYHLTAGLTEGRKIRAVNGKATTLAEHLAVLPVVAWATGDAEILTGTPALRRRFLDRGILGVRPAALLVLENFRRALLQKREILQRGEGSITEELASWNGVLSGAMVDLAEHRNGFVERLREELARVLLELDLPLPAIEIRYRPSPSSTLSGAEEVFQSLMRIEEREIRRGAPLVGCQRDELEILWGGREIRSVASAGERKVLALALLSAHGRVLARAGRNPVYLLDDADAELAAATLSSAWKIFAEAHQILATSSRPQVWLAIDVESVWQVDKGVLRPL
ncbi:MAG TPA: DNA replication and repair protein RecF [Thermoanaerobaculia bacterium]|nr:DNA replication and repair protein RecF [Thermoanaerobaculia bacterium]